MRWINMPQTERAETLKKLLRGIGSQENGSTVPAIKQYTKWEITEGGATDNTIKKYIEDLEKAGFIDYGHPFWKITKAGTIWLERHSI
jgi:hypothetical protein